MQLLQRHRLGKVLRDDLLRDSAGNQKYDPPSGKQRNHGARKSRNRQSTEGRGIHFVKRSRGLDQERYRRKVRSTSPWGALRHPLNISGADLKEQAPFD